ncbi:MAG TPA: hypothetical protein VL069_12035 [Opitutus sp.]|nr:hypothetical protein [Opitutus sp.]
MLRKSLLHRAGHSTSRSRDRSRAGGFSKSARVITRFSFVAAVLLATGCSTSPADGTPTTANSPSPSMGTPSIYQRLIKGMRRAEVANYLGKAAEVKPFVSKGAVGEIWVYKTTFPGSTRQVAAAMQDVPFVNPITGEMGTLQEPVMRNEITTITEVTELLFIKDLLVEWKQKRYADRHLN